MERWTKLQLDGTLYVIKFEQRIEQNSESTFKFWLSDFKTLWSESIASKENLFNRVLEENPTVVIEDSFVNLLLAAIGKVESASYAIIKNNDEITLQSTHFMEEGNSVKIQWLLKKCDPQEFFDQITKQLLLQIGELQDHKKQLIDIAKRKDIEIKQHKLEGAPELFRKKLITEEFKESDFSSKSQMFSCDIDEFESLIGPLPKNVAKEEKVKDPTSPVKIVTVKNLSSPRSKRNPRRLLRPEIIRPGVVYDSDDDSEPKMLPAEPENESNQPFQDNDTMNPTKRIRRSSDF